MLYEDYEKFWCKIRKQESKLFNLINKREELFEKTQPKSTQYDKELVDGKNPVNMTEEYVVEKEYYDIKINHLNKTLDDLYQVLNRKREELKLSKNLYDRIYTYYYIERLSVKKIARLVNYSERQTRRHLENIDKKLKCPKMSKK